MFIKVHKRILRIADYICFGYYAISKSNHPIDRVLEPRTLGLGTVYTSYHIKSHYFIGILQTTVLSPVEERLKNPHHPKRAFVCHSTF